MKKGFKLLVIPLLFFGIKGYSAKEYNLKDIPSTIKYIKSENSTNYLNLDDVLNYVNNNEELYVGTFALNDSGNNFVFCFTNSEVEIGQEVTCTVNGITYDNDSEVLVDSDLNIPSNVGIFLSSGSTLTVDEGVTLTLGEGSKITAANNTRIISNGNIIGNIESFSSVTGNITGEINLRVFEPTVKVTFVTTTSLKLTWNKVDNATGYEIYRSTKATSGFKKIKTVTGVSYTDTKLKNGSKYYYYVVSYRVENGTRVSSAGSSIVNGSPNIASPVVKVNSTNYNTNKVTITKVSGAKGYVIYRSTNPTSGYKQISTTTKLTYSDTKLTTGTTYYYKVKAYYLKNSKKVYSAFGNYVSSIPLTNAPVVKAKSLTRASITLTWDKVSGANGYNVYELIDDEYTEIYSTTGLTFTDSALVLGSEHNYKVVSYRNVSGNKVEGKAITLTAIAKPGTYKVENISDIFRFMMASASLSDLDLENDVVSVEMFRKGPKDSDLKSVGELSVNNDTVSYDELAQYSTDDLNGRFMSFSDDEEGIVVTYFEDDLEVNQTYKYAIKVTINGVTSDYSTILTQKVTIPKLTTVSMLNYKYNSILVGVPEIIGVDGYQIYRSTSKNGKYTKIHSGSINLKESTGTFEKTYYYKARAYVRQNGKTIYGPWSKVYSFKTGIKNIDKYPVTMEGNITDSSIKSISFKYVRASGNNVYYKVTVKNNYTYAIQNTRVTWSISFYDAAGEFVKTSYLTSTYKKGKKKNTTETFTISVPKTAVYMQID